jgi:hypothetical protein
MDRKITAKGLSAGSLYKILFIGHAFSMGLLIVCMGVFSLFGFETVHIEGVPAVGLKGLLTAIVVAAVFSLVFSFLNWLFILIGNWVYTRFRSYEIVVNEADTPEPPR